MQTALSRQVAIVLFTVAFAGCADDVQNPPPEPAAHEDPAQTAYEAALLAWRLGNFDAAFADLQTAISERAGYADAYRSRGQIEHLLGFRAAAKLDFDKLVALEPNSAEAFMLRAAIEADLVGNKNRLADLDRAIELAPSDERCLLSRSALRRELMNWRGAREDAEAAIRVHPRSSEAHLERALALGSDPAARGECEAEFEQAVELNPLSDVPRLERAEVRLRQGNTRGALADLNTILAGSGPNGSGARGAILVRASILWHSGNHQQALGGCTDAVFMGPLETLFFLTSQPPHFTRSEAAEFIAGVKATGPENAEWLRRIGMIQLGLGDLQGARVSFRRELVLDPGDGGGVMLLWAAEASGAAGTKQLNAARTRLATWLDSAAGTTLDPDRKPIALFLSERLGESEMMAAVRQLAVDAEVRSLAISRAYYYAAVKHRAAGDVGGSQVRFEQSANLGRATDDSPEPLLARLSLPDSLTSPGETQTAPGAGH